MASISAFDAKTRFGDLLDRVSKGEEVVITRHDKPVARLVPASGRSLDGVREAVQGLRTLRAQIAKRPGFRKLTDSEILSAVREGRR
jgi:prevent-host-death family protein